MNVQTVTRPDLFYKFKEFMYEKNGDDTLVHDEDSFYVQYEKAARKAREEAALAREAQKEKEAVAAAAKTLNSKPSKPEAKSRNFKSLRDGPITLILIELEATLSSRYLPHSTPPVSSSNANSKSLSKPFVPPTQKISNGTASKLVKSPTENIPNLNTKRFELFK